MLFTHVVDFHPRQLTIFKPFLKGTAGMICMDMDFHHIVPCHKDKAVAKRKQELFHRGLVLLGEFFLQLDDKFRAVAELDVVRADRLSDGLHVRLRRDEIEIQLQPVKRIDHPVHHGHEPLSAGIHYAGFLEYRKKLRSHRERFVTGSKDDLEQIIKIFLVLYILRLLVHHARNCQDRSLFRLHDGLIGCLHSFLHGGNDQLSIQFGMIPDRIGETAEKLRENDAGISSRTAKGTRRYRLGEIIDRRIRERIHITGCGHDRHRHIRSRITVRNREDIQFIDPVLSYFKVLRSG